MNLQPEKPSLTRSILVQLFSPVLLARVFFIVVITYLGYRLRPDPDQLGAFSTSANSMYVMGAFFTALMVVIFEYATNIISSKSILLAAFGLFFGLATAWLFYPILLPIMPGRSHAVCAAVFGYFGIILAIKHAERFQLRNLRVLFGSSQGSTYILDTSAIIDGRILDLQKLKFIRGPILAPQFVLSELQAIADSTDMQRRAKGRRGLDVLEDMRKHNPDFRIWSPEYPDVHEVDQKLIEMTKEINGVLVTNDYNLEKVASLQKIEVINVNELANALRPPVYVGFNFSVDVVREGKEPHQGVGYLDDGTMVVVDEGRRFIGQEVEVIVSSILQTAAGRMVFAKPRRAGATIVRANEQT